MGRALRACKIRAVGPGWALGGQDGPTQPGSALQALGGLGQSGHWTTQTGESPRSAPLTLGTDLGAVPVTVVEWQKQREQRAKAGVGRPEQRVTCVWISSLMERLVSCFFFTASRSTKGRMVMPWGRGGGYISAQGTVVAVGWAQHSQTAAGVTGQRLGTWDSDRVRDGGRMCSPLSTRPQRAPFPSEGTA